MKIFKDKKLSILCIIMVMSETLLAILVEKKSREKLAVSRKELLNQILFRGEGDLTYVR